MKMVQSVLILAAEMPWWNPWQVLVPAALAFGGVYLLLPRPSRVPSRITAGVALTIAGLILAGWLLVRPGFVIPETILFYAFAAVAVVAGGLLVAQRNPVYAALSFALVVLSSCGLFLLLAAPFLMAATIIIYAGAIIVTFLFVIMLAQQAGVSDADQRSREPFLSCLAGFVLVCALLFALLRTYDTRDLDALLAQTRQAANQATVEEMRGALGDSDEFFKHFDEAVEKTRASPDLRKNVVDILLKARESLSGRQANAESVRQQLTSLYERGQEVRATCGSLEPGPDLPTSSYSRLSSAVPPAPESEAGRRLPAQETAYLGRTLFTDYLLPVELGGTLLLVAAIGAIAIAGRRTGELR
jgi:NADH:ubiquinone oxidoreductase subunit 6 (subunit J)